MPSQDPEARQYALLQALYTARKQVEKIEAALAHNAAFLGTGIEQQTQLGTPPPDVLEDTPSSFAGLFEYQEDISDYIGREGDDTSRPRLGPNAPSEVQPNKQPEVNTLLVSQLAVAHPADAISFSSAVLDSLETPLAGERPARTSPVEAPAITDTMLDDTHAHTPEVASPETTWTSNKRKQAASLLPPGMIEALANEEAPPIVLPHPSQYTAAVLDRAFLALQATNDGIWDWTVQTGEIFQSPRWKKMLGTSAQKANSPVDSIANCLHPADAQNLRTQFTHMLAGKVAHLRMVLRIKRQGDGWTWGMLRAVCLREEGKTIRITAALADMTAQREAELALHASEEKFRALAEDSPDLICRFDSHLRLLYASPNIQRYFPTAPEKMLGSSLGSFDLSGETAFFEETLGRVFEMGMPIQAETHFISPLVGKFIADCRFWPEFGMDGEVVSVTAQIRDMTLSQRMAENYQALFSRMVDGFALFEYIPPNADASKNYDAKDFALISMNPSLGRMFRVNEANAIGHRLYDILGRDAHQWAACLRKVLEEKHPVLTSVRHATHDRLFEISAYSPEDARIACIVKDVTDLHDIEQEVRLNEARFAALYRLSHMDEAPEEEVIQFSLDHAVHLTGSNFGYLFIPHGQDAQEQTFWSREILAHFPDATSPVEFPQKLWPATHPFAYMDIRRAKVVNNIQHHDEDATEESDFSIQRFMLAPVLEGERIVCIAGVANKEQEYEASDLRQLELFINGMWFQLRRRWAVQALQRAKDEAEAANRAKNEFLANVSHELRTPLNGILGMLQVLQQSSLTEEQQECVVIANHSGRSLLRIISDILDLSRIEAGRFEITTQLFDFAATVRSTLGMFTHQAKQKSLDFALDLDDRIPPTLAGDDARVRQIIFNLVGNAFKFTERGGIRVECSLLPFSKDGKAHIYFAVHDTGIGIPDDKLGDIFRAFTQLDGSSTRRFAGTGLGLAIVRRLVEIMGGTLTIESAPGVGTSVCGSLPFEKAEALPMQVQTNAVDPAAVLPLDILVVEDDPVNQFTLRSLLKKAGHTALCVNNGRQALEALMLHPFECVITDIQMPVMDGTELAGRIRQGNCADIEPTATVYSLLGLSPESAVLQPIPQDIPIIALTAHAMTGDKERFLCLGMDYYLAKPILVSELNATLAHVSTLLHARLKN